LVGIVKEGYQSEAALGPKSIEFLDDLTSTFANCFLLREIIARHTPNNSQSPTA
jgi:hypothetical protein